MATNIADLRLDYRQQSLDLPDVSPDPMQQFERWFEAAVTAQLLEPNAMTIATVGADGRPSARVVLLKGVDGDGFTFFTNYESQKGRELTHYPHLAAVFNWLDLERQVRIEGSVERLSAAASDAYFHSRPRGSQIGAWASAQSEIVPNRAFLEENYQQWLEKWADVAVIPRPPHWGGLVIVPTMIEFWQGRSSRLHDRLCYRRKDASSAWTIGRLAP